MYNKRNWVDLIQNYKASGLIAAKWCKEKGFKVLFNEAEKESRENKEEPNLEEIIYKRQKKCTQKNSRLMIFPFLKSPKGA